MDSNLPSIDIAPIPAIEHELEPLFKINTAELFQQEFGELPKDLNPQLNNPFDE